MPSVNLMHGDALDLMESLEAGSIDLICSDLPYGTTQNIWDKILPLNRMWSSFYRVLKPEGLIVLTAAQPFTSILVSSNMDNFKYDLVWEKTIGSGQLNVKRQPIRIHETILVFGRKGKKSVYNEQKETGYAPYKITRKNVKSDGCYGAQKPSIKVSDGTRHAKSIIKISNPRIRNGHTTQKPEQLMSHLIRMYSNPGDIVLDPTMGSGTTGVSAVLEGRSFIGIEIKKTYFNIAKNRIFGIQNQES